MHQPGHTQILIAGPREIQKQQHMQVPPPYISTNFSSNLDNPTHAIQFNPLNAELNPICHLLALLGGATIVVVSRLRVNIESSHALGSLHTHRKPPGSPTKEVPKEREV